MSSIMKGIVDETGDVKGSSSDVSRIERLTGWDNKVDDVKSQIKPLEQKMVAAKKAGDMDTVRKLQKKINSLYSSIDQDIYETEAIKGADGKRCWKGKRYAGTENGKDKCVPVKEESDEEALKKLQKLDHRKNWEADVDLEYMDKRHKKNAKKTNENSEKIIVQKPGKTTIVNRTTEPTPMARAAMGALANHYQSELDDLNKKREARRQGKVEESMGEDTYEIGQQLMDIAQEIKELADNAMRLVRGTPEEGRARSYWYPHIVMALGDDHGYMGKNMATMSQSAEALMNGEDEEYMDEAREMSPALKAAQKNLVDLASGEVAKREAAKKAAAKREREYQRQAARDARPKKPTLDQIWQKVEHAISNYFPDGDPTDYLGPYMDRNNLTWDDITRACKRQGYKDLWDYWNTLAQDIENDAYGDWMATGGKNVRQRAPFMEAPDTSGPVGTQPGGWRTTNESCSSILKGIGRAR